MRISESLVSNFPGAIQFKLSALCVSIAKVQSLRTEAAHCHFEPSSLRVSQSSEQIIYFLPKNVNGASWRRDVDDTAISWGAPITR
jgi:hypothetical protein